MTNWLPVSEFSGILFYLMFVSKPLQVFFCLYMTWKIMCSFVGNCPDELWFEANDDLNSIHYRTFVSLNGHTFGIHYNNHIIIWISNLVACIFFMSTSKTDVTMIAGVCPFHHVSSGVKVAHILFLKHFVVNTPL